MRQTVIVEGARTPFGKLGGGLSALPAVDLGAAAMRAALQRARVPQEAVEHVMMGMVLQGGAGQIPARQAARKAGLAWDVGAETINKVCASGLRSVTMAEQMIRCGDADVVVAGGMESMSGAPYALPAARFGQRMGHGEMRDLMIHDGLWCAFENVHMAVHGSNVAAEYGIDRQRQDEWALRSHELALAAIADGRMGEEITEVIVPERKGERRVVTDEGPRPDTSLKKLSALSPIFLADGTVTAGNAPGVNDGAGTFVLASAEKAAELGVKPLAEIVGHASVGAEAPYLATVPALATQKLLYKTGYNVQDIDLFEINEAFAAVTLTSMQMLGVESAKVNVNGGAVALGHPIGASGARILLTLVYELRRRGGGLGVAAICSGAAQGDAILVRVAG
ncbi:acetyl-CoA C-acetyltransferase [Numidum massiliense]|uniref:acetyl-CoA C-acetyltransferase n=1 Tax=Numidum massiliense TaxID=1522315 RepID=UPI0006D52F3B|nr:acetyl-CoA C-acetyltransferase [Numidum massiliense]